MSKLLFFRQWISFLRRARRWTDWIGLVAAVGLFFFYAPLDLLNADPATGGDTASHFWPLVTLVQEGLANFHVRVWNPGNLFGEPHLTHYFPFPYFLMAFLSLFMPLGRAFNMGTIFPVIIFPVCVFLCFRGMRSRFPIPLLAALASLSFLYNESFSMWGGNILSTLAGQFAHIYAFDFLLLGVGALAWQMSKRQFPWWALLCFASVLLSHFYVALLLPFVFLCFLLVGPSELALQERFIVLLKVGLASLLLAAWFVIPMLHNSKWNTAFGLEWQNLKFFQEVFPPIFWPFLAAGIFFGLTGAWMSAERHWPEREWKLAPALIFSMSIISGIFFFLFPKLGLVDVRVFPALQLLICVWAALVVGIWLRQVFPSPWVWFLALPLAATLIWWPVRQVVNLPHWLKWNYSGWEAKTAYPELMKLSDAVRGNFSQGRILYESNQESNIAGSMRVFEMLPYFSGRSTLESVYMQATILAPAAFYMQALVSSAPSCPFPNYQCTQYDLRRLPDYLQLLGVSQLILITKPVLDQVPTVDFLEKRGEFGLWHVFDSKLEAPLVETLKQVPAFSSNPDFKREFYNWFLSYRKGQPFLIQAPEADQERVLRSVDEANCRPRVEVDFDRLTLNTDCPGKFHILKFAYHSTWKASTGDSLYLMSPGFIGLIPSRSQVTLIWGEHWLWKLANTVSWLSALGLIAAWIWSRRLRGFKKGAQA